MVLGLLCGRVQAQPLAGDRLESIASALAGASSLTLRCEVDGALALNEQGNQRLLAMGRGEARVIGTADRDDLLTVDWSSGLCDQSMQIHFDGGARGNDLVRVIGDGTGEVVYTPDPQVYGSGDLVQGQRRIRFEGLEPVDSNGFAAFVLNLPGANDIVTVQNGVDFGTGNHPAIRLSGSSGGVAFETAAVWNTGQVLVSTSGTDGNDSITVNDVTNANGNSVLNLYAGESGTDTITQAGTVSLSGHVFYSANTKITLQKMMQSSNDSSLRLTSNWVEMQNGSSLSTLGTASISTNRLDLLTGSEIRVEQLDISPRTPGQPIQLGPAVESGGLNLSDVELDRIAVTTLNLASDKSPLQGRKYRGMLLPERDRGEQEKEEAVVQAASRRSAAALRDSSREEPSQF